MVHKTTLLGPDTPDQGELATRPGAYFRRVEYSFVGLNYKLILRIAAAVPDELSGF